LSRPVSFIGAGAPALNFRFTRHVHGTGAAGKSGLSKTPHHSINVQGCSEVPGARILAGWLQGGWCGNGSVTEVRRSRITTEHPCVGHRCFCKRYSQSREASYEIIRRERSRGDGVGSRRVDTPRSGSSPIRSAKPTGHGRHVQAWRPGAAGQQGWPDGKSRQRDVVIAIQ
jgi:hypothetical protein